jgi:hypothetical protein
LQGDGRGGRGPRHNRQNEWAQKLSTGGQNEDFARVGGVDGVLQGEAILFGPRQRGAHWGDVGPRNRSMHYPNDPQGPFDLAGLLRSRRERPRASPHEEREQATRTE